MGAKLDRVLRDSEKKMEDLVKQELIKKKLVDTGKLLRSVKFSFKNTPEGPKLVLTAEDYFKYLDGRYNIINSVIKTLEFKNITEDIAFAIADEKVDEILS